MNNRRKIVLIVIELLTLLFLILFNIIPKKCYYIKYDKYKDQLLSDIIYDGKIINQEFVSKYNAKTFSIKIGTFRHFYDDGYINIEIENLTNNSKKNIKIKCFSLDDKGETIINYSLIKNHKYSMKIYTTGIDEDNGFIFYSANYKKNKNYNLTIDEEEKDYNMLIGYSSYKYSKMNFWIIILYVSVNFCIFSLYIKEKKI